MTEWERGDRSGVGVGSDGREFLASTRPAGVDGVAAVRRLHLRAEALLPDLLELAVASLDLHV